MNMNQKLFQTILNALGPESLASITVDLEDTQEDWQQYPEDAPDESIQMEISRILEQIVRQGTIVATSDGLDFQLLLEQLRNWRADEDWQESRNKEISENWYKDLQ